MKNFEAPTMDVEKLEVEDVLTASNCNNDWNMEEEPA